MLRSLAIVLLSWSVPLWGSAQERFRIGTAEGYCEGGLTERPLMHADPAAEYHWSKGQMLQKTQGGYSGRLLHGPFTAFYPGGQLREKGGYTLGARDGVWRSWRVDGTLAATKRWRRGMLQGRTVLFDSTGRPMRTELYRHGVLKRTEVIKKKEVPRKRTRKKADARDEHRPRDKRAGNGQEAAPDTLQVPTTGARTTAKARSEKVKEQVEHTGAPAPRPAKGRASTRKKEKDPSPVERKEKHAKAKASDRKKKAPREDGHKKGAQPTNSTEAQP